MRKVDARRCCVTLKRDARRGRAMRDADTQSWRATLTRQCAKLKSDADAERGRVTLTRNADMTR